MNKLRELFTPMTPEEEKKHMERLRELFKDDIERRGCITCEYCEHYVNLPGFVTGEECRCTKGLKCDTVLNRVLNCEEYETKQYLIEYLGDESEGE